MKFLTNLYNPTRSDARGRVLCRSGETQEDAWDAQERWLADKVLGPPQEADVPDAFTVRELVKMGMVGVYLPDEDTMSR